MSSGTAYDIGGYAAHIERHGGYAILLLGAGSGIGAFLSDYLRGLGLGILAVDRQFGSEPRKASDGDRLAADLATDEGLAALQNRLVGVARIDALVNCVGVTGTTGVPPHQVDEAEFRRVFEINLFAAFSVTRVVAPRMLAQGYGRILHVASIAGKEGNLGMAAYSSSKAGLIGLVKSMAKDYATSGVTVNAVAPAVIRTPLVDALPQSTIDYMTSRIPMSRTGTLQEIASLCAWAISPAASFTTGFTYDLSGGRATY